MITLKSILFYVRGEVVVRVARVLGAWNFQVDEGQYGPTAGLIYPSPGRQSHIMILRSRSSLFLDLCLLSSPSLSGQL